MFVNNELDVVLSLFVSSSAQLKLLAVIVEFLCELVVTSGLHPRKVLSANLGHWKLGLLNRCWFCVERTRLCSSLVASFDEWLSLLKLSVDGFIYSCEWTSLKCVLSWSVTKKKMGFETNFAVSNCIMEFFVFFIILLRKVGCNLNYLRGFLAKLAHERLA